MESGSFCLFPSKSWLEPLEMWFCAFFFLCELHPISRKPRLLTEHHFIELKCVRRRQEIECIAPCWFSFQRISQHTLTPVLTARDAFGGVGVGGTEPVFRCNTFYKCFFPLLIQLHEKKPFLAFSSDKFHSMELKNLTKPWIDGNFRTKAFLWKRKRWNNSPETRVMHPT